MIRLYVFFFFSSRRRHTRFDCDWSSDVCSSDLCSAGRTSSRCTRSSPARISTSARSEGAQALGGGRRRAARRRRLALPRAACVPQLGLPARSRRGPRATAPLRRSRDARGGGARRARAPLGRFRISDLSSFAAATVRLGRGITPRITADRRPQPERMLELYDFEACPYCRKVREALSELDLDYLDHPVAHGSPRRAELVRLGG